MTTVTRLLLGAWLLIPTALGAQQANLDSLRTLHSAAQSRVDTLVAGRQSALAWAEVLYRAIPAARGEGRNELRDALRAAQVAADSLAILDARLAEALLAQKEARQALAVALEQELEGVLIRAEFAHESPLKAELLLRARELAIELTSVQGPLELPATDLPRVTVGPGDGPEEIQLKADFLDDRAAQLRRAAEVVSAELDSRNKRAELQAEMRRLVAEVRLFDQARVPPAGARAAEQRGATTDQQFSEATTDARAEEVPSLVRPLSDRGVDLPGSAAAGEERGEGRSVADRLLRLSQELLRRAAGLEARAEEIRAMMRGPP